MSEGIITGTIYETRLRDKNCCLRYGKKKKKNTKCTMLLYFFGFLRLFSFHCVFLMCCFMSTGVFKLQLAPEANYFHTTSVISRG